ncbi:MAG: SRPBCC family protein [Candidatus Dormiibacterota bacterium]
MTRCERVRLHGTIQVALAPDRAFALFTPRGERVWAEDWDPEFPSPCAHDAEPGTVFTTSHGQHLRLWTVIRREGDSAIAYSVTSPGDRAGLIGVVLERSSSGSSVTVSHDFTALVPQANPGLRDLAANYGRVLRHWEESIARALAIKA